jgi:hypothetical protein
VDVYLTSFSEKNWHFLLFLRSVRLEHRQVVDRTRSFDGSDPLQGKEEGAKKKED